MIVVSHAPHLSYILLTVYVSHRNVNYSGKNSVHSQSVSGITENTEYQVSFSLFRFNRKSFQKDAMSSFQSPPPIAEITDCSFSALCYPFRVFLLRNTPSPPKKNCTVGFLPGEGERTLWLLQLLPVQHSMLQSNKVMLCFTLAAAVNSAQAAALSVQ